MNTKTRERPILFRDEMVRAILEGRKTQTRRPVKALPPGRDASHVTIRDCIYGAGWAWHDEHGNCTCKGVRCPYGAPGDRLWVREAWCLEMDDQGHTGRTLYRADGGVVVKFDESGFAVQTKSGNDASPWKPSIHLPRARARLPLEVVSVRVERLQAITEADAKAEGVAPTAGLDFTARHAFATLWDSIHGSPKKGAPDFSWAASPWVWVVEFRRVAT
jgi:hypothetical protein